MSGESKATRVLGEDKDQHEDEVHAVAIRGTRIVSGSGLGYIKVWDVEECKHTLDAHSLFITSVALHEERIVTGSGEHAVKVWNASTGECEHILTGHEGWVNSVSFSPDGARIVSGSRDTTVRVWDAKTGECEHILTGHEDWVNSVSWDGARIVSGSRDTTVRVWEQVDGNWQCVHTLGGHARGVTSVSDDGVRIVSGSVDKTVRVWQQVDGNWQCAVLRGQPGALEGHVTSVAWFGARVVSGTMGINIIRPGSVKVWEQRDGIWKCVLTLTHPRGVNSVAYDAGRIVSGANDFKVRVWDVSVISEWDELKRQIVNLYRSGKNKGVALNRLMSTNWLRPALKNVKTKADNLGFHIDDGQYAYLDGLQEKMEHWVPAATNPATPNPLRL